VSTSQIMATEMVRHGATQRLEGLLHHAATTVPFYRALQAGKFCPQSLAAFPVLGKKRYIENLENLMSNVYAGFERMDEGTAQPGPNMLIGEFTSGSSGYPLRCYKTVQERTRLALSLLRKRTSALKNFSNDRMFGFIHNTEFTASGYADSLGNLSEENIERVLLYLRDTRRPAVLHANTMLLERYADYIRNYRFELGSWRIDFIESVSESMSEEQKRHIEEQFKTSVFNCYGCLECYNIGYDCAYHGLHVNENVLIEVLDSATGEDVSTSATDGDIVLTSLVNRAQPFIRYKTGDIGRLIHAGCRCGSQAPVIALSGRRKIDYLKLLYRSEDPALTICGYDIFATVMHRLVTGGHDCLSWYNVIQKDLDLFEVLYSARRKPRGDFFQLFTQYSSEELGIAARIEFVEKSEAEILDINKKNRVFRSLLQND
jgi:phenylacetate-coenzyme A ligase PaaK-like adenylate-forming protein